MYAPINIHAESEVLEELLKQAEDKKDFSDLMSVDTGEDKTGEELNELAHPEEVKVLDSYHEDGGVVEDNFHQQEVGVQITENMPNGEYYKHTVAVKNLIDELILIGDTMDVVGKTKLAMYADNLSNNMAKYAGLPLVPIAVITGAAAILGGLYYINKLEYVSYGVNGDLLSLQRAVSNYGVEKGALISDVGADVLENLNQTINGVINTRKSYMAFMGSITDKLRAQNINITNVDQKLDQDTVEKIGSDSQAVALAGKIDIATQKYSNFISKKIIPRFEAVLQYLNTLTETTKAQYNTNDFERGTWSNYYEQIAQLTKGIHETPEDLLVGALKTVIGSLKQDIKQRVVDKNFAVKSFENKIRSDISSEFSSTPEPTPTTV